MRCKAHFHDSSLTFDKSLLRNRKHPCGIRPDGATSGACSSCLQKWRPITAAALTEPECRRPSIHQRASGIPRKKVSVVDLSVNIADDAEGWEHAFVTKSWFPRCCRTVWLGRSGPTKPEVIPIGASHEENLKTAARIVKWEAAAKAGSCVCRGESSEPTGDLEQGEVGRAELPRGFLSAQLTPNRQRLRPAKCS